MADNFKDRLNFKSNGTIEVSTPAYNEHVRQYGDTVNSKDFFRFHEGAAIGLRQDMMQAFLQLARKVYNLEEKNKEFESLNEAQSEKISELEQLLEAATSP